MNLRPLTAPISTLAILVSHQAPELVELITENSAHPLAEKAMPDFGESVVVRFSLGNLLT